MSNSSRHGRDCADSSRFPASRWFLSPVPYMLAVFFLGAATFCGDWVRAALGWAESARQWMFPVNAICFLLLALAVLVGLKPTKTRLQFTRLLALFVLGAGLLTMFQLSVGLGMDRASMALLEGHFLWLGHAGEMTALAFACSGMVLLMVRRSRYRLMALLCSLMPLAMGLIALTGLFNGIESHYFIGEKRPVMSEPTAFGLVFLSFGLGAYGFEVGGWRWFLKRRVDRRIALIGILTLFFVVLMTGIFSVLSVSRTAQKQQEQLMWGEVGHAVRDFRSMVDEAILGMKLHAASVLGRKLTPEEMLEALEKRNQRREAVSLEGARYEDGKGIVLGFGRTAAVNPEFRAIWGDAELWWEDGLHLVLKQALADGGRLALMVNLDEVFRRYLATFDNGMTGEIRICASQLSEIACLPSRLTPHPSRRPVEWDERVVSINRALAGLSGTAHAVDNRGIWVTTAYMPLGDGMGIVSKVDSAEVMAPIRERIWQSSLLIFSLILLAGLVFEKLATAQVYELLRQQGRSRAVLEHVPVAVLLLNDQGLVEHANALAEKMFAGASGDLLGHSAARMFGSNALFEKRNERLRAVRAVRQNGEHFDAEISVGHYIFDGRRHAILMVSDVSERLQHVRQLTYWEQIFRHAEWGVVIGSNDGKTLLQMNPYFARMHGYSVDELTGQSILKVFAPSARDAVASHIALAHSRGHHRFESVHVRKDGSEFPVLLDMTTVRDDLGGVRFRVVNVLDISERKQMEQALRESEMAQRAMRDSQNDLICSWQPGFFLGYVNRSFAEFFGATPDEILGQNWLELLPSSVRADIEPLLLDLHSSPRTESFECSIRKQNGDLAWLLWEFSPVRDSGGNVTGFQSVGRDISDRRQIEKVLLESEHQLLGMFDSRSQPICLLSPDGTILRANKLALVVAGKTQEEIQGLFFWEAPWSKDLPDTAARLRATVACASAGMSDRLELTVRTEMGRLSTFEVHCSPIFDENGRDVAMLIAEGRDVTKERGIEVMAAEREARLYAMAGSLPGMVYEFRLERDDLHLLYISDGVGELCGLRSDDLLSGHRRLVDCVHPDDLASFRSGLLKCARLNADWNWTGRFSSPDREAVTWVNMRARPRVVGQQVTWDGVALNITELKEKELEVIASRQAVRELSAHREAVREDERKYIAREIHDELGQNLTALRMRLAVLEAQSAAEPAHADIHGEVVRLKQLVDQSIGVVRSVATSLRPAALDMGLASALIWLADEFQGRSGIVCLLDLAGVPSGIEEDVATGFFRIVQESLTNVARHSGARKVDIMLRQLGQHLVLEIRDDGKGFDAENTSEQKGYGLMGIRERALMLGGKIDIFSVHEQGTIISVSVPLKPRLSV